MNASVDLERSVIMKAFVVNFLSGTFITGIIYYLGGMDIALETLLLFIVLDYFSGICKAIYEKKLSSKIGIKGIIKKIGYLIMVALGTFLDKMIRGNGSIRIIIIYFFVSNEGISILENWIKMNLPIPDKVRVVLNNLKNIDKKK